MKRTLCLLLSVFLLMSALPAFAAEANEVEVQILATSDLHGWFMPWDFSVDQPSTRGSLTYLATLIRAHKAANPNTIVVDDGDTVQSNYVEYFIGHEKNPMIEAMNNLGYDVWSFGNHEYNFGLAERQQLVEQFKGVTLSGNVRMKDSGEAYLPATTVVERGGVKVGFVGMTTPLIVEFEKGKHTLDEVDVLNPMDVIGDAIAELKAQGVDCIVGLFHEGLERENNVPGSGTKDLAEAFPEFDVIISGHAHKPVESETVNGVLLCEPYCYARSLSVLNLKFAREGDAWKLAEKTAVIEACGKDEDPEMVDLMKPFKDELSNYVGTPFAKLVEAPLSRPMDVPGIESVNVATVPVYNLMSTAGLYYSGADFSIFVSDFKQIGFDVGDISIKDIASSFQFTGGEMTVYPVTGRQLKAIMEYSAGFFNQIGEGDLTISYNPERRKNKYSTHFVGGGFVYTVDLTQPEGSRIRDMALILKDKHGNPFYNADGTLLTTAITDDTVLKMGAHSYYVNQWLADGGCLAGEELKPLYSTTDEYGDDGTIRNLTIRYIKEQLNGVVDGRLYQYDNWQIHSGIDTASDSYQKMLQLMNDGKLTLPVDEDGRPNIAPITVQMVEEAAK